MAASKARDERKLLRLALRKFFGLVVQTVNSSAESLHCTALLLRGLMNPDMPLTQRTEKEEDEQKNAQDAKVTSENFCLGLKTENEVELTET